MTSSPLVQDDLDVVQEVMLTKVTLLLAQPADVEEWRFEYNALRAASAELWEARNAFLLDYTLGRIVVAVDRARHASGGSAGSFIDHFTHAIQVTAGTSARNMWMAEKFTHPGRDDAVAVALLTRLIIPPLTGSERLEIIGHLPGPFLHSSR